MTTTTALFEENVKEIYEILYFFCYSINFMDLNNDVVQFFISFLNCSIVELQRCINSCCTAVVWLYLYMIPV